MGKKDKNRCKRCGSEMIEIDERKDGILYQCPECNSTACVRGKSHFKPERRQKEVEMFNDND